MHVRPEPVRDMRRDDQQALEEIRRLFARYRQIARHGQATERHGERYIDLVVYAMLAADWR